MTDHALQATLDRLTALAARLLRVPIVYASIVWPPRRVHASSHGRPASIALLLCYPLCRHIAAARRPLVVADALHHPLTFRTAAVRDGLVAAYAGVPLIDASGRAVGALCVMDLEPRAWDEGDIEVLRDLARLLVSETAQGAAVARPAVPWRRPEHITHP